MTTPSFLLHLIDWQSLTFQASHWGLSNVTICIWPLRFPFDWHFWDASMSACVDHWQPRVPKWWLGLQTYLFRICILDHQESKVLARNAGQWLFYSPSSGLSHPLRAFTNKKGTQISGLWTFEEDRESTSSSKHSSFGFKFGSGKPGSVQWIYIHWIFLNGGPPADLLINQGVWDNVSGHTTRAPPTGYWYFRNTYEALPDEAIEQNDNFEEIRKNMGAEIKSAFLTMLHVTPEYIVFVSNPWENTIWPFQFVLPDRADTLDRRTGQK